MCGIFGHVGCAGSIEKSLQGLKFLEYRGYDSSGIAGVFEGQIHCFKKQGNLSCLEQTLTTHPKEISVSIGHTRWATHGPPSEVNAHPHLDTARSLAVVHNGIVENYRQLRTFLEKNGVVFQSDTDTEVIAQLIAWHYEGDLVAAIQMSLALMKGFWALAILHKDHPGKLFVTRLENPLVVGLDPASKESFVSSDVYAFQNQNLDLYYLENSQIAVVSGGELALFDAHSKQIEAKAKKVELQSFVIDKGPYEHFMLKEIFEQPEAVQSAIHGRIIELSNTSDFSLPSLKPDAFSHILFIGCGTSWHAGCIAAQQIEEMTDLSAEAQIASEFRYKKGQLPPKTLVVSLSQSGETFDTIAATRKAKEQGAQVLSICNVPGSTLMREADFQIPLRAGPEISVCSTKAFSCQLAVLSLFTAFFAKQFDLDEISKLPKLIEQVLEQEEAIIHIAHKYAGYASFFFIGRQYMYPTSMEAALKLKEISYLPTFAYPAGELKHGAIALIDPSCLVIGFLGHEETYEKTLSNLMEVKARGANIVAFAPQGAKEIEEVADDVLYLPKVSDILAPIPYSVAAQLLAYSVAKERGNEIDQPRNLAKSVTVE